MPVHCEQRGELWRLIEADGKLAVNSSGTVLDGGGHYTEPQCQAQARRVNHYRHLAPLNDFGADDLPIG